MTASGMTASERAGRLRRVRGRYLCAPAAVPELVLDPSYDVLRVIVADVIIHGRLLATEASAAGSPGRSDHGGARGAPSTDDERLRLAALVDLARDGDPDAFGSLFDHYHPQVYRFLYYRVSNQAIAEDLMSETFFRALRSMASFQWQGKDFGAWLTTIARNLVADHYKSGRTRLELATDDLSRHAPAEDGPEDEVITGLTNEALHEALQQLPDEQQECLVLRFLSGRSIAETAASLGRSEGAVKQLQLRAVRNLAKLMPEGMR